MNKKNIFYWALYDYANSFVLIVFFLYFSQWLVVDHGVSDFGYNMIFTIGSALLLLTAPILGSMADKNGKQHSYLNQITILTFIFFALATIITLFFPSKVFLAILFFFFANYFYQFSFSFYNALLHYIAPPEKWGYVSGLGQTGNWLGQISALLVTLPLASGAIYLFGAVGRAQTFLPATILFFLLALPMMFLFKFPIKRNPNVKIKLTEEYKNLWAQFKDLIKVPNVGMFLLAYFFFNDAIITAANNFPIYLANVFAVTDTVKSMLLLGILVTSAIGAFFTGYVANKIGLKKSLMIILGSWVIIFPAIAFASNFKLFIIFTALMGFFYGATWAVTRAVMTALCPREKLNFGFSFYTMAERVSTFFGPLAWGIFVTFFLGTGPTRYRYAIGSMTIFIILGIFFLRKVEIKEKIDLIS